MMTLGTHILCEFSGCSELLDNAQLIERFMVAAAQKAGATVLHSYFHPFTPQGVSGVVVISESHFSIHTWPERGYAALDFYTCGGIDPGVACEFMAQVLGAQTKQTLRVHRGIDCDTHFGMSKAA